MVSNYKLNTSLVQANACTSDLNTTTRNNRIFFVFDIKKILGVREHNKIPSITPDNIKRMIAFFHSVN